MTTTLPSCISFSLGWFSSQPAVLLLIPVHSFSDILSDLILWIYLSTPRYNYKGFDLGCTWMALWFSFSSVQFSSVQSLSRDRLFATPWIPACQASGSITNSQSLNKLMSIESVMPSSHLILCHPFLLLPPILPSIRVFSNESYWSFSFSINPSNEYPGLISFRMDLLDPLAVQGTFKSLLQHYSSKASFIGAQLSSQSNHHIHTWPLEKP